MRRTIQWLVEVKCRWNKIQLEFTDFNRRVVQTVVGTNSESDVTFTVRVSRQVPIKRPCLERVVFFGQFAVCSRRIDGIVPIGATWRLDFNSLNQSELSVISDDIKWIWARLTIPSRSCNDSVDGKRITIVLFDGDTGAFVVKADDVVD